MLKTCKRVLCASLLLAASSAQAELPEGYKMVVLTENFPPFNMAVDDKNFARDDGIDGISAEIVREMFKRAGIDYSMTLRFPWDRLYRLTLDKPGYALFSTTRTAEREALFKWVGPLGETSWVLMARGDSAIQVNNLSEASQYRIGAYKNNALSQSLESQKIPLVLSLRDQENIRKLAAGQIDL